jgi:amino acid adenylation domain-containing protein
MKMADRELIFDRKLMEEKVYWVNRLSSIAGESGIRLDFERPERYVSEKLAEPVEVGGELSRKLLKLAGKSDFLIYATLLTAWSICLTKYNGNERIVVGSPVLNRTGDESTASCLLAIVADIRERVSFRDLLLQIRESLLAAYQRQNYPLSRLITDLKLESMNNRSALFDTIVGFKNIHTNDWIDRRNDITLSFESAGGGIKGSLIYNRSLFRKESMSRLTGHFLNVLLAGLADPEKKARELEMLAPWQRHYPLLEFNATQSDYPKDKCLHELVEAQARRGPDAIALVSGPETLSYRALSERANQLAHYLMNLGVGPEVLVGVYIKRSVNMVVALLAILKAGGAYVPLDASNPKDRIDYILRESGAKLVVSEPEMTSDLPEGEFKIVFVSDQSEETSLYSVSDPASTVTSENPAYVIYTSGSTGKPKGVVIPHRGVVNYLSWCRKAYRVDRGSGAVVHTPLGFDLTVTTLYSPLVTGKRCVLLDEHDGIDGLSEELRRGGGYSLLKLTPAHLEVLRHRIGEHNLAHRANALVIGGEALLGETLRYWREHAAQTKLINEYGPTETVVGCCVYEAGEELSGPIAIGKPIANTQIYVLDDTMEPVPEGVIGEIYVGGEGLARGYLADPLKTALTYMPSPYEGRGERLYRTGDMGRHRADGNLDYAGRGDGQVKIRGYRVEIGDVESVLREEAGVEEAVVVVRGEGRGDQRLIGYVVNKPGSDVENKNIKRRLREKLPEYMVPAVIIEIAKMPLSSNGKIDRRALASVEPNVSEPDDDFVVPRTAVEEMVAGVWADLLKLKSVGVHANLFDLGAHSLLATQAISRIRSTFNVEITLRSLYENPTVAGLANKIEDETDSGRTIRAAPIERIARDGDLPLSFAQQRLWFLDQLKPNTSAYNVPAAVRLRGKLDLKAFERALRDICLRHEVLNVTFRNVRGRPVQTIQPQPVRLRVVDLRGMPTVEREIAARLLVNAEARQPFDLKQGPLIRTLLFRLDHSDHIAEFTLHHIITDGWSMALLIREFATLYEAYSHDNPSPLADPPIQYSDYASWQRRTFTDDVMEGHLAYWRGVFGDVLPVAELPSDRPRQKIQSVRGSIQSFTVSKAILNELEMLSHQESVTLFMTLTAAYRVLLYSYTGQNDVVIGTDIANRNQIDTEGLIGFFVNQLPLRLKFSGDPTFAELLAQVRNVTLGAYAHQDLPFEKLVDALKLQRSLKHAPIFQVKLVLQNLPIDSMELSGLTITPLELDSGAAKFDLTLLISEKAGELYCAFEYNTDLFDRATIISMSGRQKAILSSVTKRRDIRVSELKEMLIQSEVWRKGSAAS